MKKLNRRQVNEWAAYVRMYSIGADRTSIDVSHQTYHMLQAWLGKEDKRLPTDLAPQFDQKAIENTEAQNIWANMRSKFLK